MKKILFVFAVIFTALFMTACSQPDSVPTVGVEVGDIVLADGSIVKPISLSRSTTTEKYFKYKPIGVVIRKQEGNTPALCIGIKPKQLKWCENDCAGYDTVSAIYDAKAATGVEAFVKLAEGTNGSSLLYLDKYPAWEYCLSYNNGDDDISEEFRSGWYLPARKELELANNDAVKRSLIMLNSTDFPPLSGDVKYWTSNQYGAGGSLATVYQFWNDYVTNGTKNKDDIYTLPVHVLSVNKDTVAVPVISPEKTDYTNDPTDDVYVTMATATPDAEIYFVKKNGASNAEFHKYESPMRFDDVANTYYRAMAVKGSIISISDKKEYKINKIK